MQNGSRLHPDPLRRATNGGGATRSQGPPPPSPVVDVLHQMRSSLDALDATFLNLNDQTQSVAALQIVDPGLQRQNLEMEMQEQDKRQGEKISEIKDLIQRVVANQVAEQIKKMFANEIESLVQREVELRVSQQMAKHIPAGLQNQVDEQKRQLIEVDRNLHNGEARRVNALIKSSNLNEGLRPLLRTNGRQSDLFPHDLMELFARDDNNIRKLLRDFELQESSSSREKNLNTFMQFCGVTFQLIPAPPSTPNTPIVPSSNSRPRK